MKLYDLDDGSTITLPELKNEWKQFRSTDTDNFAETFPVELFEILMATINDRNNLEIVGMTPAETSRYTIRLRNMIERR